MAYMERRTSMLAWGALALGLGAALVAGCSHNAAPAADAAAPVADTKSSAAAAPGAPAPAAGLSLFGTPLKDATRAHMREVLRAKDLKVVDEDNKDYKDHYDASKVLEGATDFYVGYDKATQKFAYAEYTLPSRLDADQISRVIALVQAKYGEPVVEGDVQLGDAKATWKFGNDMEIIVQRGWPDTTTYLAYVDQAAYKALQAENATEADSALQKKAQQSQAL